MRTFRPSSTAELAEALGEASAAAEAVTLRGAASKQRMGAPPAAAAVLIDTLSLHRVLAYEPRDLTISVEAGMKWRDLTALLAAQRQMIPLDPPCAATATVGGVVSTHSGGPRRRLYGGTRDMVIGITYITVDGKIAHTGGMVVKNVAGLDIQKALVGSFGTLAALAAVNFKLSPQPEQSRTYVLSLSTSASAGQRRNAILGGVLQPAAIDILNPSAARLVGLEGFCLVLRAGGPPSLISRYDRELDGAARLDGGAEAHLWNMIEEFAPSQDFVVRAAHPLSALPEVLDASPGPCICRAGTGVSYLSFSSAPAAVEWMTSPAHTRWGRVLEWSSAPAEQYWPGPGIEVEWMKKLKFTFDPHSRLNRGRLYGRI